MSQQRSLANYPSFSIQNLLSATSPNATTSSLTNAYYLLNQQLISLPPSIETQEQFENWTKCCSLAKEMCHVATSLLHTLQGSSYHPLANLCSSLNRFIEHTQGGSPLQKEEHEEPVNYQIAPTGSTGSSPMVTPSSSLQDLAIVAQSRSQTFDNISLPTVDYAHRSQPTTPVTPKKPYERKQKSPGKPRKDKKNRVCAWCKTTETPEWRQGPSSQSLCNACGLQYRKIRNLTKSASTTSTNTTLSPPQHRDASIASIMNR